MANQPESPSYDAGIYQLEVTDAVDGGVGAKTNAPLLSLANRTNYLKQHLDNLESGFTIPPGVAPIASPSLTGNPTAPTQAPGDSTTKLATTAFVQVAVNGLASVGIGGGTATTLTQAQWGCAIIILTGAVTANKAVLLPNNSGHWQFVNKTTGNFTVTLKTAAGNGVTVSQGSSTNVFCDGTDVGLQQTDMNSPALSGNPTAPTQPVGDNSTKLATTAFVQAAMAAHVALENPHTQYLLRKDFAKDAGQLSWLGTAGGTASALVLTPVSSETVLPALAAGQSFRFIAAFANPGGGVTANVAGRGAIAVKRGSDSGLVDLDANDIKAGSQYDLNYDGTYYQLGGGVGSGKAFERFSFVASVAQSVFTFAHTPGSLIALRNGREITGFTSDVGGTKVTLAIAANLNDQFEFLAFKSFKTTDTYTKSEINNLMLTASALPVGSMLPFPVNMVPPGFLEIDASVKSIAVYPDLAAYLGTRFNTGGEGAGNFRMPESRAEFFRGWDHGRGVDVGRTLGSNQAQSVPAHTHTVQTWGSTGFDPTGGPYVVTADVSGGRGFDIQTGAVSGPVTTENVPRNLAVMWCMKAWNAPVNQGTIDIAALSTLVDQLTDTLANLFKTPTNVTASRAINTPYINDTGRPIFVNVSLTTTAVSQTAMLNIEALNIVGSSHPSSGGSIAVSSVVPPGATYKIPPGSYTLAAWTELR